MTTPTPRTFEDFFDATFASQYPQSGVPDGIREVALVTWEARERDLAVAKEALKAAEAERDEAMRVLKLANDSCRSAYQIAARKGSETEWETWQFALQKSLNEQHRFMFPWQYTEERRIRAHDGEAP